MPRALKPKRFDTAVKEVRLVTRATRRELMDRGQGRGGNPLRWLTIWWVVQATGASQARVARHFDTSPAAVSRALSRV